MRRLKQLTLLFGDLILMYMGLFFAVFARRIKIPADQWQNLLEAMSWLFVLALITLYIVGLYDLDRSKNNKSFYQKLYTGALAWLCLGVLYFYVRPQNNVSPKTILVLTAFFGFGFITLWRFLYNKFVSALVWQINLVFIGITPEAEEAIKKIQAEPQGGYRVAGIISDTDEKNSSLPNVITGQSIEQICRQANLDRPEAIILCPSARVDENLSREIYRYIFKQTGVIKLGDFYEETMGRVPPFVFSDYAFIYELDEQKKKIYDRLRILSDLIFAVAVGVFFAITFPLIALLIKIGSKGPIFFKQKRIGKHGREFSIYKYRTMKALNKDGSAELDGPQFATEGDKRITAVGKFLRKTRLDEIPQFINILKREMGVIGPRPERKEFVEEIKKIIPCYELRHLIKPGLTGWAQINQGYTGDLEETSRKFEYDLYYIKNRGPLLDLAIILKTVNIVAKLAGK